MDGGGVLGLLAARDCPMTPSESTLGADHRLRANTQRPHLDLPVNAQRHHHWLPKVDERDVSVPVPSGASADVGVPQGFVPASECYTDKVGLGRPIRYLGGAGVCWEAFASWRCVICRVLGGR